MKNESYNRFVKNLAQSNQSSKHNLFHYGPYISAHLRLLKATIDKGKKGSK